MNPLVSILIPTYNAEHWIADTIHSALGQTWERKEIIVVDDGSKDRTLSVLRQFDARGVKVVSQHNQGAAAARNTAFSLCQGDYIQWLDADDILAPDKISKQIQALDGGGSRRTLLSSSWGEFLYCPDRAHFVPTALWCDLSPLEWTLRKMEEGIYIQTTAWLVSRELTEAAGPWDTRLWVDDDGEYFCRVVLASDEVRFVKEARAFYRNSGFNRLSYVGRSDKKVTAQFLSIRLCIDHLLSLEDSERSRAASLRFLQRYMLFFYPERHDIVQQAHQLAAALGGRLASPRLSWKYAWIQRLFGWRIAKYAQLYLPRAKASLIRWLERTLFLLVSRSRMVASGLGFTR
jgi:glycosyltransferase involved in cell wall biosynthesis